MASLSLSERMTLFKELVQAQDKGTPVAQARRLLARRYGLSEQHVRRIEEEGLADDWPLE
jgi:hypothetical protein